MPPLPADNLRLVSLGLAGLLLLLLIVVLVLLARSIRQVKGGVEPVTPEHVPEPDDADLTKLKVFSADLLPRLSLDDPEEGSEEPASTEDSIPELRFEGDAKVGVDENTGSHDLIAIMAAGQTDRGRKRRRNEDACLVDPELDLYIVADGMGGYAGGDIASAAAVKEVREAIRKVNGSKGSPKTGDVPRRGKELIDAIERANGIIHKLSVKKGNELAGMGTTIMTARFLRRRQRVYIAHVGDSRIYRFRDGALRPMTTDHTLGAKGVTGPLSSNVRRAVGVSPTVKVDLVVDKPLPNDIYLLCSDGMYKMLDEPAILRILNAEKGDPQRAVAALVAASNEAGGKDNISVVIVGVQNAGAAASTEPRRAQAGA